MCKGEELEAFLKEKERFDKMIYIGDGSNDFCPILRLRAYVSLSHRSGVPYVMRERLLTSFGSRQDVALARLARGLEQRIKSEGQGAGLKCQVQYWEGAWEVEEFFSRL